MQNFIAAFVLVPSLLICRVGNAQADRCNDPTRTAGCEPGSRNVARGGGPATPTVVPAQPSISTLNGQRYLVMTVPSQPVPAQPSSGIGTYAPPGVSPLAVPPPVLILDGASPTVGTGAGGFALPEPGVQPSGTLTNPNGS